MYIERSVYYVCWKLSVINHDDDQIISITQTSDNSNLLLYFRSPEGSSYRKSTISILHDRYLRSVVLDVVASYEDVLPKDQKRRYTAQALDLFNDWLYNGKQ